METATRRENIIFAFQNDACMLLLTHELQINHLMIHHFSQELIHEKISEHPIDLEDEVDKAVLTHMFIKPFIKPQSSYQFFHEVDLDYNIVYQTTLDYWKASLPFTEYTLKLFTHLKATSEHPNIKDGDFFIIEFADLIVNDQKRRAIGLFKIEQLASFLTTDWGSSKAATLAVHQGIQEGKLDKACLIIELPSGPEVYLVDKNNEEANFWKYDFIGVSMKNDHYNQTVQTMEMTQHFIKEQFPHEFEVQRVDQIDLMNKSMDYFKSADQFKQEEFEQVVLQDEHLIESFRSYQDQVQESHAWSFEDEFQMVPEAVKKNQRFYKSVIKLDKNFHIYVHGNREMIEQGQESDGRKYYKLYFDEEH